VFATGEHERREAVAQPVERDVRQTCTLIPLAQIGVLSEVPVSFVLSRMLPFPVRKYPPDDNRS
jgi:hypothetical protein